MPPCDYNPPSYEVCTEVVNIICKTESCVVLPIQGMSYDETLNIRKSNLNPIVSTVTYYKNPLLIHQVHQCFHSLTVFYVCHMVGSHAVVV